MALLRDASSDVQALANQWPAVCRRHIFGSTQLALEPRPSRYFHESTWYQARKELHQALALPWLPDQLFQPHVSLLFLPPSPYAGDLGSCSRFLFQCSIVFDQQPSSYSSDKVQAWPGLSSPQPRGFGECRLNCVCTVDFQATFWHPAQKPRLTNKQGSFGEPNSPSLDTSKNLNDVLRDMLNCFIFVSHLDDILIFSRSLPEHTQHVLQGPPTPTGKPTLREGRKM
ncbi:hypothetical protein L3Q82_024261 [Scortum barcoo]|uniref:Uncharacterized protein n=1 Tax=Scortum barcoo TaxID=214431 RepID=A0ACB8WUI7_9TELE|nr:hypothetical protein L3Q82_024261 [Scortum barcoo]